MVQNGTGKATVIKMKPMRYMCSVNYEGITRVIGKKLENNSVMEVGREVLEVT